MAIKFIAAFGDWQVNTEISPVRGVAAIRYDLYLNKFYYGDISINKNNGEWECYIRNENDLFSSEDRQILIDITKEYHENGGKDYFEM